MKSATASGNAMPPNPGGHPVVSHMIESDGIRLHARERGAGCPIMMTHGMWSDGHAFDDVVAGLAGAYRIVCPDLRGHGRSATPARAWTVGDLARDLTRILDALEIETAVVVGHSLGGMAALQLALRYPDRLRGLVLLSTSAEAEKPERRSQLGLLSLTINMWGMSNWLAGRITNGYFSAAYARRCPDKVKAWRKGLLSMEKRALLQALEAVQNRPSVWDRLQDIAAPALVMGTREDPIADPARSTALARQLRNAQLVMLPGGGHALPMEHPQELSRALHDFLGAWP